MKYQPHVDGLRAFAVLPVVLYHFGVNTISGGFLGVDVFFVISGYLISTILLQEIDSNSYSLLNFYKKRVLRLIPALILVFVSVYIIGSLIMLPSEKSELGKAMISASFFASNIYFWTTSGYFSAPAEYQPLLHTWSLAVEEQFYIFFPPLLFLIVKYIRSKLLLVLLLACLSSFLLSLYLTLIVEQSSTAFYLIPARAWELGFGAVLAAIIHTNRFRPTSNDALCVLGLALVVVPYFIIDSSSIFPGIGALWSCMGATLVIAYGGGLKTNKVLASPIAIWFGKISYSLYLWHWPVVVFWKILSGEQEFGITAILCMLVLSVILSVFSTFYIEKPFRSKRLRASNKYKVLIAGSFIIILSASLGFSLKSNYPEYRKYSEEVLYAESTVNYRDWPDYMKQFRTNKCFITSTSATNSFDDYDKTSCAKIKNGTPNILLIGDSHSAQFYGALVAKYPSYNIIQANASGCLPLLNSDGKKRCTDMLAWLIDEFITQNSLDAIVISGRWKDSSLPQIEPTLNKLKQFTEQIVFIGPAVEYEGLFPMIYARSLNSQNDLQFQQHLDLSKFELNNQIKRIVATGNHKYVDLVQYTCKTISDCRVKTSDGTLMQFDYGHLTLSATLDILDAYDPLFPHLSKEIK